jgi:hypothetical protein
LLAGWEVTGPAFQRAAQSAKLSMQGALLILRNSLTIIEPIFLNLTESSGA